MRGSARLLLAFILGLSLLSCATQPRAAAPRPAAPPPVRAWTPTERKTVALSFIALAGCTESEPAAVSTAVKGLLGELLPEEELVWGPALHFPGDGRSIDIRPLSDALVFISRDRSSGDYSVVFRGTNTVSASEWLFQDFMVEKQIPWRELSPGQAPAEAAVSEGAATALRLRLGLKPEAGEAGAGVSLAEALVSLANGAEPAGDAAAAGAKGRVIRFTGHSLGGLLAPTAALWLLEEEGRLGRADPLGGGSPAGASGKAGAAGARASLEVYAYAGPTAGNAAFARYLESRLPSLRRYASPFDIAPRAWEEAAMAALPGLYRPSVGMQPLTKSFYDLCAELCRGRGYEQPGPAIEVPSRVIGVRGKLYLLEAAYQHMMPYLDMLEAGQRDAILGKVIEPIAASVSVPGLKPIELEALFMPAVN